MNRLFVRVLLGIALALSGYAVIASLLFWGLNSVRLQQFQENLAVPLVAWVRLSPQQHIPVLQSVVEQSSSVQEIVYGNVPLNRLERERLEFGQIVVKPQGRLDIYLAEVSPGQLLELRWEAAVIQSVVWTARIVSSELGVLSPVAAPARLRYWRKLTGLEFTVSDVQSLGETLARLPGHIERQGYLIIESASGKADEIWVPVGTDRMLLVSRLPRFDAWSLSILASLVFTGLVILAGALYLSLENLDRRLRKLETVASRIARGELEARVDDSRFDAIGRLGQVFNRMADHIQRLVGVQREMIHAVSHELRTPVARIRFGVQMIEDCTDEAMRQKQLTGIDADIQELNELIDEILTYARLEQGGPILDFQEVNLINIVNQVVQEQKILKPDLSLEAKILGESVRWNTAQVEPRYIHRSVQNLVGNAIRYAVSKVIVSCNFGEETCRIDVEDDGPGIPESDWEKVFTPFARLDDSRTRSSGGYGLGLSIVRRILYWHGGQAFVARSDFGGAKFSLVWPRVQAKEVL